MEKPRQSGGPRCGGERRSLRHNACIGGKALKRSAVIAAQREAALFWLFSCRAAEFSVLDVLSPALQRE